MGALLTLISQLIEFYIWIVIASAVLSWLVAFDVINMRNRFVFMLGDALNRLTERSMPHSAFFARYGWS